MLPVRFRLKFMDEGAEESIPPNAFNSWLTLLHVEDGLEGLEYGLKLMFVLVHRKIHCFGCITLRGVVDMLEFRSSCTGLGGLIWMAGLTLMRAL